MRQQQWAFLKRGKGFIYALSSERGDGDSFRSNSPVLVLTSALRYNELPTLMSHLFIPTTALLHRFHHGQVRSTRLQKLVGFGSLSFPLPIPIPSHSPRYHNFAVSLLSLLRNRRSSRRRRSLLLLLLQMWDVSLLGGYLQPDPLLSPNVIALRATIAIWSTKCVSDITKRYQSR